ncbi:MAG: hypothetical protein ACRC0S_06015 [Fusobacteriaceae bacterium]
MSRKGKKIILILVEGYSDLISLELIKKLNPYQEENPDVINFNYTEDKIITNSKKKASERNIKKKNIMNKLLTIPNISNIKFLLLIYNLLQLKLALKIRANFIKYFLILSLET